MKKTKIFHFLLLSLAIFLFTSIARAELKIDSVYPNVGEMGKDLTVTVRGSGFDENTRVSVALATGNRNKIIGSVDTPGYAYDITVVGETAYVADGYKGVHVIDISDPSSPVIIGSVDTPGWAEAITVVGETAYVADREGGVQVISVSDPSSPMIIGSVDTPGWAEAITVVDETAYVADKDGGVHVIGISQLSSPEIIGSVVTPGDAENIMVVGETAYVVCTSSEYTTVNGIPVNYADIQVIDISHPSSPVIIGSVDISGYAYNITVVGETAYVADGSIGVLMIDISHPSSPEIIGTIDTLGKAQFITVVGETAYVANEYGGVQVIDISSPSSPVFIGSTDTPGNPHGIMVVGETAYVADGGGGVQVIDIIRPESFVFIGSVDTLEDANDIAVVGDTAYVAGGYGGVYVIDISDPSSPVIIGSVDTPGEAYSIIVVGEIAYVADKYEGVQVIDISDPSFPVIIGSLDTGAPWDITVVGETAVVLDFYGGVQVIDVSDPSFPVIIGSVDTPGEAYSIMVVDDTAYVADGWYSGVQIIDISHPSSPVIIGSVDTPDSARAITVVGETAYVADREGGVQVIDISQPSSPVIIGSVDTPGYAMDITVVGEIAYVADGSGGVQMIDISQPSSPVIIGSVDIPGSSYDITVVGETAFVTDGNSRLAIVSLPSEISPLSVLNESEITFTIPSPQIAGNYTIRAFNQNESDEKNGAVTFADKETFEQLKKQKAIILVGSDSNKNSSSQQSFNLCANYAYVALMNQGYEKENIHYLSAAASDTYGDGIPDVDGNATYQNFKSALLNWASDAGDLIIFMVGHGSSNGKFEISRRTTPYENVTVQELDSWLDIIQQNMTGKVILINESCYSGSFIAHLEPPEGKERIVITSASSDESAWLLRKGRTSFSYQFWASVAVNANLYESFVAAKDIMEYYQTCQINANGDTTPNDKTDQILAQSILIGRGGIAASSPPYIANVSEDQVLQNGVTSSIIKVFDIYGLNPIKSVWAVIVPPGLENASSDTPITDLDTIELEDPDGDGTYEGVYENFSEYGTYNLNVYAEDSEGLYAVPLQTSVTQTQFNDDSIIWNKIRDDLWIRADINTVEKGLIQGQWQLGGQDTTARGDQVFWGYFYASPDDVTWGSSNNPDLFVKIWADVSGPIYVDYFHVSVPDITVYTDFNAGSTPAADQTHTATLTTRFVEHSFINGQSGFTMQNEDGEKPSGYSETAAPFGSLLTNNLRIGSMINTVEKGPIEGIWSLGGQDTTARGDTVIWGHFYADPLLVTWGSLQNPDLFVKIWFDVGGMVNVDFFHVSVPDIEVYSELPADGAYDNSGTTVLGNRFIEHRYVWK